LNDFSFSFLEQIADGLIVEVAYKGAWLLIDNGYLNWSTMVPPMKQAIYTKEIRWSQWVESLQKDVECTFGIPKGWLRILKSGIQLWGVGACDKIWCTCCALHNWLLDINGYSYPWDDDLGIFDDNEVENNVSPAVLQWLYTPAARCAYDMSGMGRGSDMDADYYNNHDDAEDDGSANNDSIQFQSGQVCNCHKMPMSFFQSHLIEHFDILFQQNKIVCWPTIQRMQ